MANETVVADCCTNEAETCTPAPDTAEYHGHHDNRTCRYFILAAAVAALTTFAVFRYLKASRIT